MKKELSMEVRLLLAFVLMGLVLVGSQYFLKSTPAPTATKDTAKKNATAEPAAAKGAADAPAKSPAAATTAASTPAAGTASGSASGKADAPAAVQAEKEETTTVETDNYRVVFSNRGAVVKSWLLKGYKDHSQKPLELVNQRALAKAPAPLSLVFKGQAPATDPNNVLFKLDRSADGMQLTFDYSDGRVVAKKTFRFEAKSFLVNVTSEVTQNGTLLPHSITWRGGFGDESALTPTTAQHSIYYDLANSKLQTKQAKDAKDGPVITAGQYSFAGLEDAYFAAAFLPGNKSSVEQTTFSDNIPNAEGKDEQRVGAGVGGDGVNQFGLFVGPKDTDLLRKVDPKLEQIVDWGWFGILAKPLFLVLNYTADKLTHSYGWAIVLVTIAINFVLLPVKISQMKSAKKMQQLQPQIAAINAKYQGVKMNDPRNTEKNEEVMELYKKNGVNPVGGCLPLLLQLPFLWAFYKVLSVSIEMRGASWLWAADLSQPDVIFGINGIHLLPILLIITQFLTQKMTPTPGMDPTQQKMMMFMPLMMGYMFYFASSGLVLYWLTGNVVGVAQQWLLNRNSPTPVAANRVIDAKPVKKTKK
jgi:YidC/Oxa1 family membrane protein insertase